MIKLLKSFEIKSWTTLLPNEPAAKVVCLGYIEKKLCFQNSDIVWSDLLGGYIFFFDEIENSNSTLLGKNISIFQWSRNNFFSSKGKCQRKKENEKPKS